MFLVSHGNGANVMFLSFPVVTSCFYHFPWQQWYHISIISHGNITSCFYGFPAVTLRNGGNVLVPCYSSGVTYDLFECLSGHLDEVGLSTVTLYFLSPVADSSLAYSNIYAEWLSSAKQNKIYLPEYPFPHSEVSVICRLLEQDLPLRIPIPAFGGECNMSSARTRSTCPSTCSRIQRWV